MGPEILYSQFAHWLKILVLKLVITQKSVSKNLNVFLYAYNSPERICWEYKRSFRFGYFVGCEFGKFEDRIIQKSAVDVDFQFRH